MKIKNNLLVSLVLFGLILTPSIVFGAKTNKKDQTSIYFLPNNLFVKNALVISVLDGAIDAQTVDNNATTTWHLTEAISTSTKKLNRSRFSLVKINDTIDFHSLINNIPNNSINKNKSKLTPKLTKPNQLPDAMTSLITNHLPVPVTVSFINIRKSQNSKLNTKTNSPSKETHQ